MDQVKRPMMEKTYNNINELQAEIAALKLRKAGLENVIDQKFSSPGAVLSTALSLFQGNRSGTKQSFLDELIGHDTVSNISRLVVPVLLNSLVFKRSGFITKTLVTYFSQKAASNINTDTLSDLVGTIKNLFGSIKKGSTAKTPSKDYGIPPDSETY